MGQVHRYPVEVMWIIERPSKNFFQVLREGGISGVAVDKLDVGVVEPVQYTAYAEHVPTFCQARVAFRDHHAEGGWGDTHR